MPASTAIKVISLKNSLQRREEFAAQAPNNIDWSFFDAHTGPAAPLVYDAKESRRRFGRDLSPAEIGCYTSHFKCWEWLANSTYDQLIIFEDDTLVDWAVIKELAYVKLADYGLHYLRLFTTHPVDWKIVRWRFLSPHYHLIRTTGVTFGMQGYILTKAAAERLVKTYAQIIWPIDWVTTRYWEHGLVKYCLFPFCVMEKYTPSTIGDERHQTSAMSPDEKLARLFWRARDKLGRLFFNARNNRLLPLGPTQDSGSSFFQEKMSKRP